MMDNKNITTECVRVANTPGDLFDVLLENYSEKSSKNGSALNLVFHRAHVSCRSFGMTCDDDCSMCNGNVLYECVLARYLDGFLVNVLVMPSVPIRYGVHDVLVGFDVHPLLLPELPDSIDPQLLKRIARGYSYSPEVYQETIRSLSIYGQTARSLAGDKKDWDYWDDLMYTAPLIALGLAGEAGEVANKVKKVVRNSKAGGSIPSIDGIVDEVGDVLWYCAALLDVLEYDMSEAMLLNIAKIEARKLRDQIATENRGEVDLGE